MTTHHATPEAHKRFTLSLTSLQLQALWRLVEFANHEGDAKNWHRSAGASPAEIRAMGQVMEIVGKANATRPAAH